MKEFLENIKIRYILIREFHYLIQVVILSAINWSAN